jgi:phosphoserine phosphatase RsbU/P
MSSYNPKIDHLELLYQMTQAFNSSLNLGEVLNKVMDEVIHTLHAERGFVMLYDDNKVLTCRVARNIDQETIKQSSFEYSRNIVERSAQEGIPLLTSDAQTDARFSGMQSVMLFGLRSVLCVPIITKEQSLGAIFVDNRMQTGVFTPSDLELLTAIASTAAIAIDNARLYALAVEKGRLERELQMAQDVQKGLLPKYLPDKTGWDFGALWLPARQVAGDYYDFIHISNINEKEEKLGVVIADVTDKGMPAALFMAVTRSTIRASIAASNSPSSAINQANNLISVDSFSDMFVTLFYAQINLTTGEVVYVNAGHNPPFHYAATNNEFYILKRTGTALGIDEMNYYEQKRLFLQSGDLLFLYTDGVTDAENEEGINYEPEQIQELLYCLRYHSSMAILESIEQNIRTFISNKPILDDITMVIVKKE